MRPTNQPSGAMQPAGGPNGTINPNNEQDRALQLESQPSPEALEEAETATDSYSDFESDYEGPKSLVGPDASRTISQSPTLERVRSSATIAISATRMRAPQRPFSHPLEAEKTDVDVIVDFEGKDDPYRPINWSFKKKIATTLLYGTTSMTATFASSVFSPAVVQVAHEFNVGVEVATLGISFQLLGMGFGTLLWGPLSEVYGRKLSVMLPVFVSAMFAFGVGAADNIQTALICRFFEGFFGSAPVTNTGGVLGDIWSPAQRGAAMAFYVISVVGGPCLGPIVGSAICVTQGMRWRWTQYITGIFVLTILTLDLIFVDESYPATLLVKKAKKLRLKSGNWALHAKHEEWDVSIGQLAHKYLVRPINLLMTPICLFMALYASFCYGLLFASLGSFPYVFQRVRGWSPVVGSLPFISLLLGCLVGAMCNALNQKYYVKKLKENNGLPVPEARLPPMMFGSIFFTAGMFMFAWTGEKDIYWFVPQVGIFMQGIGFCTIFQSALNYLVDTFRRYSASAVAANTFLRSCLAAAFPLFITYELEGIGIGWGISVFAFVSAIMIPIPYVFFVYGKRIRARGVWSRESVYPDQGPEAKSQKV